MTKEGTQLIPTVKEAEEIAFRFINGHFKNAGRDRPRMSIPADPMRDDDIRLLAFIRNSRPTPPTPAGAGTETPRTESMVTAWRAGNLTIRQDSCVPADFARQLERELTSLRRQAEADRATKQAELDHRIAINAALNKTDARGNDEIEQIEWLAAQLATADKDRERLKAALKECAKERKQLIEGIVHAENEITEFRNKYYDEDIPEGTGGSPEGQFLRNLEAHCSGSCIGDDGEFMPRDKFDEPSPSLDHGATDTKPL